VQRLDPIDRKIIGLLRLDGRMPNVEIAGQVGLSASACLRRIKLLEESGAICGYTAILSGEAAEGRVIALTHITLDKQTGEHLDRFEQAVRMHPEIVECFLMTGDADYILRVVADSMADYEQLHKEVLSRLPGVSRIQSRIAIRSVMVPKKLRSS
jgi:DNA-binding Lrp family transcriptional regulator